VTIKFETESKILIVLIMLFLTLYLGCDLIAYKFVSIGFTFISGAVLVFPLSLAMIDVITELYGTKIARFVIWLAIFCDFIFIIVTTSISHLPSPTFWHKQGSYNVVLNPMLRLYFSCVVGMAVSSLTSIHLLAKWKIMLSGRFFFFRSVLATIIGFIIYTLITDVLAFYQIANNLSLLKLATTNLLSNLVSATIYLYLCALFVAFCKVNFKFDAFYQKGYDFNPYKL
jgi:queuosine precursor transporter